jgi:hypothetical protein
MANYTAYTLASGVATTGATTSFEAPVDVDTVSVEVNVTTAGTTGTYQIEGSMDGTNWYAVTHIPDATDTAAQSATYTTTGRRMHFVKNDLGKWWRLYRLNATTITGQTYSATAYALTKAPI